jgi:hypothetical protein
VGAELREITYRKNRANQVKQDIDGQGISVPSPLETTDNNTKQYKKGSGKTLFPPPALLRGVSTPEAPLFVFSAFVHFFATEKLTNQEQWPKQLFLTT